MITLIFCHGWGYDHRYWQAIAPYFSDFNCLFWELGYLGAPPSCPLPQGPVIGIGHSFGFIKLRQASLNVKALIGLQAFTNFLGNEPSLKKARYRRWHQLHNDFITAPEACLAAFHNNCGMQTDGSLNVSLLTSELVALSQDYSTLSQQQTAQLILASTDDPIVPPRLIVDNFQTQDLTTVEFYDSAKHNLGNSNALTVANRIKKFIIDYV